MTYQELIDNIRDLGFSDDEEMEEFGELVPNAINRAISEINLDVPGAAPRNKEYDFTVLATDTARMYIDMESVDPDFMEFAETYMLHAEPDSVVFTEFNDFEVKNESTIVIDPAGYEGTFRVIYKAAHAKFTGNELSDTLPLTAAVHYLVPLLASYYVWLEDEPSKAVQYLNRYEQLLEEYKAKLANKRLRVRVLPGGM